MVMMMVRMVVAIGGAYGRVAGAEARSDGVHLRGARAGEKEVMCGGGRGRMVEHAIAAAATEGCLLKRLLLLLLLLP